ncbi:MAG: ABC transporter ATP-binding protein [Firmicutes bacterium]|nr:ABC transporter ATP-binding protein [Bacillota bacterium]
MAARTRNFLRFLRYVKPYRGYVLLTVIGGIVKFTVPLFVPQITRHLLDHVYLNPALSTTAKFRELYRYVGGMMAVFVFIWAPWTYVRHYYAGKAGHRLVFDLRCELYEHILRLSASFFDRHKSGGIVSRLIGDIALAQNLVGSALTNVWMDAVSLFVIVYFLLRIDVPLTMVALITFPLYLYFFRVFGTRIREASHRVQEEVENISGNVQEKIAGSLVIHAFGQEKAEGRHFIRENEQLFSSTMRTVFYQSLNMAIPGVLTQLAPLIVALFGGYRVITGRLTVGELVAVGMYLGPLYLPLQRFSELNVVFANSMAALDRIFELMDEQPEVVDRPGAVDLPTVEGRVEFDHVFFSYKRENGAILQDVSFTVEPGQRVALVGPSGAGKTTLVNLIPRFYDVDEGAIKVDGHDIRSIKLKSLRRHIGIVLQDPILFSGSIKENVLYGNPRAGMEEVIAACKAANAHDFITTLPQGYESEVGERGAHLSGGQRQRITIARAFLKNPRILILDEATSALDAESEKLVQEALERLMVGRTTFIIAHRLSTIIGADLILVLDRGRLVEAGTHAALMAAGGIYRRLFARQFGLGPKSMEGLTSA